jgi:RNA polymerase sigma-70 factor (ECF subfamily)
VPNEDLRRDFATRFNSTCWTAVADAAGNDSPEARKALAELCQAYWYPLYAFLRRRGCAPEEAEDLTQGFFADLLARDFLKSVDPTKGRFRSFLLTALNHYVSNRRDWRQRLKRGGKIPHVALDFRDAETCYSREPARAETPERLFDRRWALTLLGHVLDRLEREIDRDGKAALFERLKPVLMGERTEQPYAELGAELGMSERAIKVAVHRLRKRFRSLLQEEITRTLADPGDLQQEINDLFLALSQ